MTRHESITFIIIIALAVAWGTLMAVLSDGNILAWIPALIGGGAIGFTVAAIREP